VINARSGGIGCGKRRGCRVQIQRRLFYEQIRQNAEEGVKMKLAKCRFEKDVRGFYLTPLIGFSNVHGKKSVWIGWFHLLITIEL